MRSNLIAIVASMILIGCGTVDMQDSSPNPQLMPLDSCVVEYLAAYTEARRLENTEGCAWGEITSQDRADNIQAQIGANHPAGGAIVGYKVTTTSDGRVVGVVTEGMLVDSGSRIDLASGGRLLGESDMLARVGSTKINSATTLEEVAASIDQIIPIIESSDLFLPEGAARTKAIWTSSNAGARWLIVGQFVDVTHMDAQELVNQLASVEVELIDETGHSLQRSGMNDHPLSRVLDIIEDMQRRGDITLKAGDIISLGNFGRPRFPTSGSAYKAVFHGLADPAPEVEASYQ